MQNKLDMWIMSTSKYFHSERVPLIRDKLEQIPEAKINFLYALRLKDPTLILLCSIFLGILGIDRFILGDTGLGVGKLLTLGGFGIWAIIDLFFVGNRAKELNYAAVMNIVHHSNLNR